ncbi:hypothetical protein B7463_g11979, partial [Scytalidium lignicola]
MPRNPAAQSFLLPPQSPDFMISTIRDDFEPGSPGVTQQQPHKTMDTAEPPEGREINVRELQSSKRRRIGMACIPCRNRKARCDGLRPRCTYCTRHSYSCAYKPASQMIQVSQEYVQKLKERAEAAERHQSQQREPSVEHRILSMPDDPAENSTRRIALSPPTSPNLDSTLRDPLRDAVVNQDTEARPESNIFPFVEGNSPDKDRGEYRYLNRSLSAGRRSHDIQKRSSQPPFASSSNPPEKVYNPEVHSPSKSLQNQTDIGPNNFYGDSSSLSFMQAVQTTILSHSSPESLVSEHFHSNTVQNPLSGAKGDLLFGAETCLPQRSVADDLVDCFFTYVDILYPFLHEPSFRADYEQTWVSKGHQDHLWLAILNVIFALGIHFAYDLEDKSAASDRLFSHAQKLVSFDHFADVNLRTLQFLLLSGLYFQSTSRPNQTWNTIGLAIRIATSIGVHLDPQPEQYNPIQMELRRRCWYGCVVLDRVLALNFGRPAAIPDCFAVSMPSNIDDQYITEEEYLPQDPTAKTKIAVFLHSIAFSKLMYDVLTTLYSPQIHIGSSSSQPQKFSSSSTSPEFKDVVKLDRQLVDWLHNLPSYLQAEGNDDEPEFRRVKNILIARFLNLRVLIHRPFAPLWQQATTSDNPTYLAPIDNSLHAICVSVCKSAATQLIKVISKNYYQGLSSAWWTDMNYLFTASSVLLVLDFEVGNSTENIDVKHSIANALEILQHMRTRSSMAAAYVVMLEKAQEGLRYANHNISREGPSRLQIQNHLNSNGPNIGILHGNNEVSGGIGTLDDFLRTDRGGGIGFNWNMQDLYLMPWEMVVDNPMRSFE